MQRMHAQNATHACAECNACVPRAPHTNAHHVVDDILTNTLLVENIADNQDWGHDNAQQLHGEAQDLGDSKITGCRVSEFTSRSTAFGWQGNHSLPHGQPHIGKPGTLVEAKPGCHVSRHGRGSRRPGEKELVAHRGDS
eukprot:358513-Chlamydomonas_euryale.AAC.8